MPAAVSSFSIGLPELIRDLGWRDGKPFQDRTTDVDAWNVVERFVTGGRSNELPVVFLHGLVISSLYFIPLAECLHGFAELRLPDQPGFGRSTGPRDAPDVKEMAALMIRWMDAAGIRCCHLVANSLGCQIAAEMAVLAPDRCRTLTLIGPTTDSQARSLWKQSLRILWDAPHEPPQLWLNHALDQWRAGCRRIWQMIFHMLRHRMVDCLPKMKQPVLLIRGERDPTVPARWTAEVATLLSDVTVRTFRGWHCVHYSHPDIVASEIRAFIEKRGRDPMEP